MNLRVDHVWWASVVSTFSDVHKVTFTAAQLQYEADDDKELEQKVKSEPVPKSLTALRNHPLCVFCFFVVVVLCVCLCVCMCVPCVCACACVCVFHL